MKILMVMYGKAIGGAELQFIELANELAKRHQVRLISLGGGGAINATEIQDKIDLRVYTYEGKLPALYGLLSAWLNNLFYGANAIVTTSILGNLLGLMLTLFANARLISLQTVSKAMRRPALDRFVLRRFDKLVAGSADIKEYLINHGQSDDRIVVVNNWVDFTNRDVTASAEATRRKFDIGSKDFVIGCVGRLHCQKGQEYLIEAFRKIREESPNSRLVLVGDGPDAEMLKDKASDLGDSVTFCGSVVGSDYNNLINAFDIYVQPSRFEGMPRTLLDAMYLEKPIVATAVNGNRDAINDSENGLLVASEDADAIALAVKKLINKPHYARELAKQAHEDALSSFDMVKQLQRIEELL